MNRSAQQHLAKAKDYIARGEEYYRKAKPEIDAAYADGATEREIAQVLSKPRSWVHYVLAWDGAGTLYGFDTERRKDDRAKQVLREAPPEQIAGMLRDLPVEKRVEINRELGRQADARQKEREQRAAEKAREVLGDETVEGLEFTEAVQETGWYLIKANQDLAGFLKRANELGIENVPDRFRESWLDSLEGAEGKLGMARALIQADDIDWTAFEDMLGKEVN